MALTPLDIHNKNFSRSFRGYDEDEVNEFLDQVIKDYETVIREKKELSDQIDVLNERLEHYTNIEETLNRSILVAQETGEEVKDNANKESELMIKDAEEKAARIVNEARTNSKKYAREAEELKRQANSFRSRLRMLVESQLEMIDRTGWDEVFDEEIAASSEDDEDTEENHS